MIKNVLAVAEFVEFRAIILIISASMVIRWEDWMELTLSTNKELKKLQWSDVKFWMRLVQSNIMGMILPGLNLNNTGKTNPLVGGFMTMQI